MALRVLSWDWKEQPPFDEMHDAVRDLSSGKLHLVDVETHSDQYAWVLSDEPLTDAQAFEAYRREWER